MKIVEKNIRDLKQAEYNPRQLTEQQHKELVESLEKFGFVDPILINKNKSRKNVIIGGHQRVKVATMLGIAKVPCVELDLSLEKEKELNVRLNKNTGEWDWDMLANNFDTDDLLNWGFIEQELGVDSSLTFEVNNNYDETIEYPEDAQTSHVRMIQLFLNDETEPVFKKMELELRKKFETDNLTDTVFKSLEHIING
tara:strand:- start:5593 stop:6183 length:591 start_codon:yes stop_codon:yes gene_type:complete